MTYDQRPCPEGSTPLSVTRVVHFPLTPMHVPPGLYAVGNWRSLSEVTRRPWEKNLRCKEVASWSSVPSHCKLGSVNAKSDVWSERRKSIVEAQDGSELLTRGNPFWFPKRMQKWSSSRFACASGPHGMLVLLLILSGLIGCAGVAVCCAKYWRHVLLSAW